jgi:hypothetical protein
LSRESAIVMNVTNNGAVFNCRNDGARGYPCTGTPTDRMRFSNQSL